MGVSTGASIRVFGVAALLFAGAAYSQTALATNDPVLADGLESFNKGSYSYSLPRLLQAANHGSPVAMRRLGIVYQDGLLHPADPRWGLQWFQRAVFAGDAGADSYIGDDYALGSLGSKDPAKARLWYDRGYVGKDARATLILAELAYRGTGERMNLGRGGSLLDAANGFRKPTDEPPLQPRLASDYFELGARYDAAKDAPHKPALAAALYAKAAALGQLSAAIAESKLYLGGHGLRQDLPKAASILDAFEQTKSISFHAGYVADNSEASSLADGYAAIGEAYERLGGSQTMNAVPMYKKASYLGTALPAVTLAMRYAKGDGIAKNVPAASDMLLDLPKTSNYYSQEARLMVVPTLKLLSSDYAKGEGVAADPVRANILEQRAEALMRLMPVAAAGMASAMPAPAAPLLRYPNMLAPPSVAPGAQFPVSVSLNSVKLDQGTSIVSGDAGNGQLSIPFPDGMTSILIVVTLMPSKMTIVDGVYQRTIELTKTQDTLPAVFMLQANSDPGPSTIFATLSYNGAPIGMIRRDVNVAVAQAAPTTGAAVPMKQMAVIGPPAGGASVPSAPTPAAPAGNQASTATAITLNPEERAADMTITELTEAGGGLRYLVTTKESEFDESTVPSSAATLTAIVNKLYSDMESWGEQLDEGTLSSTQVKNYVNGAMSTFYDQQAPDAFKRMYTKLEKRGERPQTILVLTDKPVLPWELMRPTSADGLREDPLAVTVAIVHTNSTSAPKVLPPLREGVQAVAVVAPTYTGDALAGAQQEVKNMQAVFPDLQQVAGTLTAVSKLAQHPPDGIVHYAGHGVVTTSKVAPNSLALPLSDSNTMDPATWKGLVEDEAALPGGQVTHPFYFFNACDQGQSQGVLNYVDGWAPALMQSGASGYLGALWKVSDTTAESFSKHFYTELAQKMASNQAWSVADVVTDARAATYKEKFDPTALSYILYAHPYLTMNQQ
jgi:TPR repeat protein